MGCSPNVVEYVCNLTLVYGFQILPPSPTFLLFAIFKYKQRVVIDLSITIYKTQLGLILVAWGTDIAIWHLPIQKQRRGFLIQRKIWLFLWPNTSPICLITLLIRNVFSPWFSHRMPQVSFTPILSVFYELCATVVVRNLEITHVFAPFLGHSITVKPQ